MSAAAEARFNMNWQIDVFPWFLHYTNVADYRNLLRYRIRNTRIESLQVQVNAKSASSHFRRAPVLHECEAGAGARAEADQYRLSQNRSRSRNLPDYTFLASILL